MLQDQSYSYFLQAEALPSAALLLLQHAVSAAAEPRGQESVQPEQDPRAWPLELASALFDQASLSCGVPADHKLRQLEQSMIEANEETLFARQADHCDVTQTYFVLDSEAS